MFRQSVPVGFAALLAASGSLTAQAQTATVRSMQDTAHQAQIVAMNDKGLTSLEATQALEKAGRVRAS